MKAEKFAESLNHINDRYLEEALSYKAPESSEELTSKKPFRAMKVWRAVAIAACALLVVGAAATTIGLFSGRKGSSGGAYFDNGAAYGGGSLTGNFAANMADGSYGIAEDNALEESPLAADSEEAADYEETAGFGAAAASDDAAKTGGITAMMPADENAKIIYTAYLNMETSGFDEAQARIEAAAKAHSAYFESLDQDNYDSYRTAYYQIRVPAEEFENFLKDAEEIGTVTSISQNAADVSESYYDIESRLETAKTKLARLQELLSQAQNMSDIITIESEIADVQWEIDDLSGSLKYYDSQISYSTVSLTLREVYRISGSDSPLSFAERMSSAFKTGVKAFANGMEDLLIWFAANWIWMLIVAIVIAAAILIPVKAAKKEGKKQKPSKQNK